MGKEFACLFATILAACLVMMLHEILKTIAYHIANKKEFKMTNPLRFIDPIGLIFAVTGYCGFSKPYTYPIKDKKTNLFVGYTGFVSLLVLFLVCTLGSKFFAELTTLAAMESKIKAYIYLFLFWIVQYMAVISLGMFFANLFPIIPFDMSNLIAGYSAPKYVSILKNDYSIKMLFFLIMILGVIKTFSVKIFLFLYGIL